MVAGQVGRPFALRPTCRLQGAGRYRRVNGTFCEAIKLGAALHWLPISSDPALFHKTSDFFAHKCGCWIQVGVRGGGLAPYEIASAGQLVMQVRHLMHLSFAMKAGSFFCH